MSGIRRCVRVAGQAGGDESGYIVAKTGKQENRRKLVEMLMLG